MLLVVAVIFKLNFGWGLVGATALAVAAYIYVTRAITEWRTKLREQMNKLDGTALARAVDSLLNYETVKYFNAESREEARYAQATQAYAKAAVKSENSLGLLNIAQAVIKRLQRFQCAKIDLIHGRTHQDHMPQRAVARDAFQDDVFEIARIGEIEAFVDAEGQDRRVRFDFEPMDIAEMLGPGNKPHFSHMRP